MYSRSSQEESVLCFGSTHGVFMGDEHVSGEQEVARSDRGMDNPSPLWPLDKLTPAPDGKEGCILLTTGAMNPCHLGHVAMLHAAATRVQRAGYHVCGAFLSPSHDLYVRPKAEALGTMAVLLFGSQWHDALPHPILLSACPHGSRVAGVALARFSCSVQRGSH